MPSSSCSRRRCHRTSIGASSHQPPPTPRYCAWLGGQPSLGASSATALAVVSESIVDVLSFFYTLLSVSLFVPILAGLYLRRVGTPEALGAIAGGVGVSVIVQFGSGGAGVAGLTPAMIGLVAAALGAGAVAGAGITRRDRRAP